MENKNYNQIKSKITNLQNSIVQRAIIKDEKILNDAKNYIDLIYTYTFHNSNNEEVTEWFKIKDVILLSNLHYIKNQKDEHISNTNDTSIDYIKILSILNDYQKYMKKNCINYNIPYFDFENEIKIKKSYQLKSEIEYKLEDDGNIYYTSGYNTTGKILKLEKKPIQAVNDKLSVFAVIHNLLIRTKVIPKTDYLLKLDMLIED